MKYLIMLAALFILAGNGCLIPQKKIMENDIGAAVYPMKPKYTRLPHLGQVYTALDNGDRVRAGSVQGFKDGEYAAGVTLRWKEGGPSAEAEDILSRLGFTKIEELAWRTVQPLTLEQLLQLKPLILDPNLASEDCVRCG